MSAYAQSQEQKFYISATFKPAFISHPDKEKQREHRKSFKNDKSCFTFRKDGTFDFSDYDGKKRTGEYYISKKARFKYANITWDNNAKEEKISMSDSYLQFRYNGTFFVEQTE
ncbi:hypothetical protein AGMMS49965_22150 [Bacteroidia bacterium]|nr:hypothetical protein AGMMS49965_22150 [Bacteroidia bacterium]